MLHKKKRVCNEKYLPNIDHGIIIFDKKEHKLVIFSVNHVVTLEFLGYMKKTET